MVNLLPLEGDERVTAVLPVREYEEDKFVFMGTAHGTVKKTPLTAFSRPRSNGIIALGLKDGDHLVDAMVTDGAQDVFLFATTGKAIRFNEQDVRPMGRTAAGVRGIKLPDDAAVVAMISEGNKTVLTDSDEEHPPSRPLILTATENGYGKRTEIDEYSTQGRGGQGVIAIQTSERNGAVVGALMVHSDDQAMLISANGTMVRTPVDDISIIGRNTQGVRLIRIGEDDKLVGLAAVEDDDSDDEGE